MGRQGNAEKHRFWSTQLHAWRKSGLTQAEFCRRQGIRRRLFCWWKRRLTGMEAPVRLIPVTVRSGAQAEERSTRPAAAAARDTSSGLTLVTSGGYRIEVADGFAPDTLARLLAALRAL